MAKLVFPSLVFFFSFFFFDVSVFTLFGHSYNYPFLFSLSGELALPKALFLVHRLYFLNLWTYRGSYLYGIVYLPFL